MFRYFFNPLSHRCAMPAPPNGELFEVRESFRLKCKACGRARSPLGGAVAQRLRGFKSAEPEKTVKRSSRRSGVNLQFFPVEPTSLGLKGASSPFFVAPARRNRWHFSGSLLVSKENIPRQAELPPRSGAHSQSSRPIKAIPIGGQGGCLRVCAAGVRRPGDAFVHQRLLQHLGTDGCRKTAAGGGPAVGLIQTDQT